LHVSVSPPASGTFLLHFTTGKTSWFYLIISFSSPEGIHGFLCLGKWFRRASSAL